MRGQQQQQDNNGDTLINNQHSIVIKNIKCQYTTSEWKFWQGGIVNNKMTMKAKTTR